MVAGAGCTKMLRRGPLVGTIISRIRSTTLSPFAIACPQAGRRSRSHAPTRHQCSSLVTSQHSDRNNAAQQRSHLGGAPHWQRGRCARGCWPREREGDPPRQEVRRPGRHERRGCPEVRRGAGRPCQGTTVGVVQGESSEAGVGVGRGGRFRRGHGQHRPQQETQDVRGSGRGGSWGGGGRKRSLRRGSRGPGWPWGGYGRGNAWGHAARRDAGDVPEDDEGDDELRHDGGSAGQPREDGAGKASHPGKSDPQAGHDAIAGLRRHDRFSGKVAGEHGDGVGDVQGPEGHAAARGSRGRNRRCRGCRRPG
ncbi:unnamed protein product [Ectocarpus sp. 8 AP-2014]